MDARYAVAVAVISLGMFGCSQKAPTPSEPTTTTLPAVTTITTVTAPATTLPASVTTSTVASAEAVTATTLASAAPTTTTPLEGKLSIFEKQMNQQKDQIVSKMQAEMNTLSAKMESLRAAAAAKGEPATTEFDKAKPKLDEQFAALKAQADKANSASGKDIGAALLDFKTKLQALRDSLAEMEQTTAK